LKDFATVRIDVKRILVSNFLVVATPSDPGPVNPRSRKGRFLGTTVKAMQRLEA
jgi:hypothetical protein